ncbi:MAG: magnesium/cobalt transporter CorA [Paludibacteraceae bacterium]|nr:magnesium/cobalt transporter CorA [Paludibacteraceae bacterium]MBP5135894.1 magnesium/cobalt transporter CorA [Paludibacteraceae bacterium]
MSELKLFYKDEGKIKMSRNIELLKVIPLSKFIWIDLNDVADQVEDQLEEFLKIYIQEEEEIEEIELSARYIQTEDTIVANSHFMQDDYQMEPVSFILKNNILVSVRYANLKAFHETVRRIYANPKMYESGYHVLASLLETRIELDADVIEDITSYISTLSSTLKEEDVDDDMLINIKELQEKTMLIRENIIDKQRVVSNMLRSDLFPRDLKPKLTMIIKDINSLIEHTNFSFDRLDYLQDTFLGLVNIQQNKIIKIFTIVSVVFMPPTLIASIYGMNFQFMPELSWRYGYPFAIGLMIICVAAILLIFKKKKWL